ncbi:MAG: BMC domain-containing protein [Sporolactobacillus sp.]
MTEEKKPRRKYEILVPGRQITIAQIVSRPDPSLCTQLGIEQVKQSLGVLTLTPKESAIIAGDIAVKYGGVNIQTLDRFKGTLIITGKQENVNIALKYILQMFRLHLGFDVPEIRQA